MGRTLALLAAALIGVAASIALAGDAPPTAPAAEPTVAELMSKAEKGDAVAARELGARFAIGVGVEADPAQAAHWYRKSAEQGDAKAQWILGFAYERGDGVGKDPAEAVRWYRKSAEQGDADAQWALGSMYARGEGVGKDPAEAVRWYRKSAEQGNAESQWLLGVMYDEGILVARDPAEAVRWYRESAEQGSAMGQYFLAASLASGGDVQPNLAEAARWYRASAVQGYSDAQRELGVMLEKGQGVQRNLGEALLWYRRASDQGDAEAQTLLGQMYARGAGAPKNDVLAYKWLSLGAAGGVVAARSMLASLSGSMSRAEIAEAQRIAAEFVAKREVSRESEGTEEAATPAPKHANRAGGAIGSASGFSISANGYVVTSQHVVASAARVEVLTRSGTYNATIVKSDETNDITVLKIEARLSALPIVPSKSARLGATVGTVGFPNTTLQGLSPKLSKGEIASLAGPGDDPRYFQISVAVQPGNSGGPLFDEHGNVVGIVAAKLREDAARATSGAAPENVNYAIKSSFLLAFLESIPGLGESLPPPAASDVPLKFEDVVKAVEEACVLVVVY